MVKDYDFDASLKGLVELVGKNLKKSCNESEYQFKWLTSFTAKARHNLTSTTEEVKFKMPKTPARKMTRQQKKRVLNEDDENNTDYHSTNDVPFKKGKLSHEEDELSLGGRRPSRQASQAAKSKIQQCSKVNLRQKLRRPSGEEDGGNTSSFQESGDKNSSSVMDCGSPELSKARAKQLANETITVIKQETSPSVMKPTASSKADASSAEVTSSEDHSAGKMKVNFALESTSSRRADSCELVESRDKPVDQEEAVHSTSEPLPVEPPTVVPVEKDPPKKTRPPRKGKKISEIQVEDEKIAPKVVEQTTEVPAVVEEQENKRKSSEKEVTRQSPEKEIKRPSSEEDAPKKKTRKVRKPVEEKPTATVSSPRVTRNQKNQDHVRPVMASIVSNSPRLDKIASKRNLLEQNSRNPQFNSPNSSPVRKAFTPKLVFSPYKAASVKTKVEAFEAALGSSVPGVAVSNSKPMTPVLPEARVLLKRLTDQELKEAGADVDRPSRQAREANPKRGTFVLDTSEEKDKKTARRSIAQILARKSVDKAKYVALTAARNKLLNSVVDHETTESPNVHVNKNAANLMSKFRFNSGSSSSSSSSLNRYVAMTQGKAATNVVTGVGIFTGTKPVPMPTKVTEDDELRRKEVELKRLKEKEEEAARKREELMKAKAEEQKRKHDARAKRAMEQRMLRAKQLGEEQKQKLENKEEKSAHLKQKLLAENQEKAERVRAGLLQRQHEAEQRRKHEEQLKLEMEEEQLRIQAAKKEQEELEKLAKLKQAEAEKAKVEAERAKVEAEKAKAAIAAGPSTLNTTVTLPSSMTSNYQITPVRVTKSGKIFNPDNYDIADMRSDDSTDDDSRPKKVIPSWARSVNLKVALAEQAKGLIEVEKIFPPAVLLVDPNLNTIFKLKRARFNKRTSSAVWKTPPAHYM